MPAIPVYQQRNAIAGVQSAPSGGGVQISSRSQVGEAMGQLGGALGRVSDSMHQIQQDKLESRAAMDVAATLSQGRLYWQQYQNEKQQAWQPGQPDLRESMNKDFQSWHDEQLHKLPTEKSRNYFMQQAMQMRDGMLTKAYDYTEAKTTDHMNAKFLAGVDADEQYVHANPDSFASVYRSTMEPYLARTDISESDKIKIGLQVKQRLAAAAEAGRMQTDPAAWYQQTFGGMPESAGGTPASGGQRVGGAPGGAAGFDSAVAKVLKHEGGFVAKDGNSGAPANYGINQRANSDIDVRNLTQEGAVKLYKERYWDTIKGDTLPAALQATAFDAAVNQGPGNANKWIKESGGDPVKFNALRRAHYESLLKKDEYKRFRKAWMSRLGEHEAEAASASVAPTASASFKALPWEQQVRQKNAAEALIKQQQQQQMANTTIEAARAAVTAQNIGPEGQYDTATAASEAVAAVQERTGRTLDPQQIQVIEAQVQREARQAEAQRRELQLNNKAQLLQELDANGGDFLALQAQHPDLVAQLPRGDVEALQKYGMDVATGATRVTDSIAYAQLAENPTLLMSTNLDAIKDKLDRDSLNTLRKMQAQALKDKEAGQPQTILSDLAVINNVLDGAKVTNKEKRGQFMETFQREMYARMAAEGKTKMPQAEMKALAEDMLAKVVTDKGLLWDSKAQVWELEVPRAEEIKIRAALQEAGMPVNASTIMWAYARKLQRQSAPPATPPTTTQQPQGSW